MLYSPPPSATARRPILPHFTIDVCTLFFGSAHPPPLPRRGGRSYPISCFFLLAPPASFHSNRSHAICLLRSPTPSATARRPILPYFLIFCLPPSHQTFAPDFLAHCSAPPLLKRLPRATIWRIDAVFLLALLSVMAAFFLQMLACRARSCLLLLAPLASAANF